MHAHTHTHTHTHYKNYCISIFQDADIEHLEDFKRHTRALIQETHWFLKMKVIVTIVFINGVSTLDKILYSTLCTPGGQARVYI